MWGAFRYYLVDRSGFERLVRAGLFAAAVAASQGALEWPAILAALGGLVAAGEKNPRDN